MNKIILIGNICQDLELNKYNDKSCIRNSIAVKRDYKNKEDKYDTDFFNITLWGSQADFINKYAKKGTKILITGKLINNEYETENGEKRTSNDIQVDHVEILSRKSDETKNEKVSSEKSVEDEEDFFD